MPEESIAAAEWREVSEGRLASRNGVTAPLAPFLPPGPRSRYLHLRRRYQSMLALDDENRLPNRFEDTERCRLLVEQHGSEVAAEAVRSGNVAMLSFLTGLTNREVNLSDARTIIRLLSEMRRDGFLGLFVGDTDGGKTNTALWLSLLCFLDCLSQGIDVAFATNVTSLEWTEPELEERTFPVYKTSALEAVCKAHEKVIAVIDEIEIEANATTNNHAVNEHWGNLMTFKSKNSMVMFPIFHRTDGLGAAPLIRNHASYFIEQICEESDIGEDTYRANLYQEHTAETGFQKKAYESEIPPVQPDADYNPDERAKFDIEG